MNKSQLSKVNHLIGYILYVFIIFYGIMSLVSLIINYNSLGILGFIINISALTFEVLGPFYSIYFMVQLIDGVLQVGEIKYDLSAVSNTVKVSVIVPIHNVNPVILKDTLMGFKNQSYTNFDVWVGDDSTDSTLRAQSEKVTKECGYTYYYEQNDKFKAHMINLILPKLDGDFVAFFDVDHIPEKDILAKFVAILEQYPEYSFVQSKYGFRNAKNWLHVWEAMSLTQLFCSQNARRKMDTVLYQGSTACFRRDAIKSLPEGLMTEDYAHSVRLMSQGKKGYFLDELGSMSLVPETIDHQLSQLYRWSCGNSGTLVGHPRELFKSKTTFRQALDIIFSSTVILVATSFYFLGVFYGLLYLLKLPIYRVLGLNMISLLVMPIGTFGVYFISLCATTWYTSVSGTFPLKIYHVPFFLMFGSFTAPFLLIPVILGMFRKDRLTTRKDGKKSWNKKLPLYTWGAIFSLIGLCFSTLAVIAIFDFMGIITWYGYNLFFIIFGIIGLTLTFSLPFIFITKRIFKSKLYESINIFH